MTRKTDGQFAPKLSAKAPHEIEVFHATSIDRWMDLRALARVATMEAAPRSAWAIVEAKFRYDSGLLARQDPGGRNEQRIGR